MSRIAERCQRRYLGHSVNAKMIAHLIKSTNQTSFAKRIADTRTGQAVRL